MSKIELICIGNLKFKELNRLESDYTKKIGHMVGFQLRCLKEVKFNDEEKVKIRETQMILETLDKKDFVILLDVEGKSFDSIAFSNYLSDKLSYFSGKIVFVIGGFSGVAQPLLQRANLRLSFSPMTMAHDVFRIVFLEQLYRALTIMKGMTYHR